MKNNISFSISAFTFLASFNLAAIGAEQVVNIYNWSDYIAEGVIEKFEQQTGIKVNYDVFDSNEILEAKLLTGGTGYDIVVPSASFLERQIKAGLFQKLDKSKLPNLKNLDETIMQAVQMADPNNEYSIVYMWGTTGIGYNVKMIEERMENAPTNSWELIFNPEILAKFADCGVSLLDAPDELIPAALIYLGLNPLSEDEADLQAAEQLIKNIRPLIRSFNNSQYISDLANGDICIAHGYSGDILQARDRADEAENDIEINYSIPKEGAIIWFDMMAIPVDAPNPQNALKFMNYIMQPEIAAEITNYVWYANANQASYDLIDEEIINDKSIYPPKEIKAKLVATRSYSLEFDRLLTRAWTRIKTGQ